MPEDSLQGLHVRLEKSHIVGGKYKVTGAVGFGGFGSVYKGVNTITGEEVAIKCESHQAKHPRLKSEYKVYMALAGGPGVPFAHWFGTEHNYNAIVLDLLGHSLENKLAFCYQRFSLKTTLILLVQIISRLEYVHSKSFIHGDIRPENFVLGLGKCGDYVSIIDFGFTRLYCDPISHLHIPYCEKKEFTGGAYRYASLNAHCGIEQSCRDDLESLGYMSVQFIRGLPWQGLGGETNEQKYERIAKKKMATSIADLCHGLPNEFAIYFRYVRSLRFNEKPNYSYLIKIFLDLFTKQSFQYDCFFDWKIYESAMRMNQNTVKVFSANNIFLQFSLGPVREETLQYNVSRILECLKELEGKHIDVAKMAIELGDTSDDSRLQELADLHCNLLYKYTDFLVASHHPAASPNLQKLTKEQYIPQRMWKCGINAFLERLYRRLPGSLEHLKAFIRMAFPILIMLLRVVPAFENTWMEYLGDIARYCSEVNREEWKFWSDIAQYWYKKCAHQIPNVGRLQHHLGTLAWPNGLQQVFHYTKSVISIKPFQSDSIQIFFAQFRDTISPVNDTETILSFLESHAMLYDQDFSGQFFKLANRYLYSLDSYISQTGTLFCEQGTYIVSSNYAAILEYGRKDSNILMEFIKTSSTSADELNSSINTSIYHASYLSFSTLRTLLQRVNDKNVRRSVYISLAFLSCCASKPRTMDYIQLFVPWESITNYLNTLILPDTDMEKAECQEFLYPESGVAKQLPEDILIRGQIWSQYYYPADFFRDVTPEEGLVEHPSTMTLRDYRCLWLGMRIASFERWITYRRETRRFQTTSDANEPRICRNLYTKTDSRYACISWAETSTPNKKRSRSPATFRNKRSK